jgi:glycosyltransferase involved in cell wall biosynthesis
MKVNFIIEGGGLLKYIGCSTAAKQFIDYLSDKGVEIKINSKDKNFDIIHAHTFGPFALNQSKKNKNAISIISAHSTPSINKKNIITGEWKIWNRIYKYIYNKFDYVLAVSEFSVKELKRIGIKKDIFIVENGIDRKKFYYNEQKGTNFRKNYDIKKEDLLILNIAQITPRKGIYDFIEVAKKNPDYKFFWVGGFPYKYASSDYFKLRKIYEKNAYLDNFKFVGFVEDIIGAYSAADMLFTPSYAETFGLTIIEAAACKLPTIARDLEVFRQLFGENISYGSNNEDFTNLINKFNHKKIRYSRIKDAYFLSEKYDIKIIANKLYNIYEKIVNQ